VAHVIIYEETSYYIYGLTAYKHIILAGPVSFTAFSWMPKFSGKKLIEYNMHLRCSAIY